MYSDDFSAPPGSARQARRAFTLVEMLVVIGVIVVLLGLVMPAITSLKGGQDMTAAAYDLAGELEMARSYAVANHTYTWVGFYEQSFNASSAPAPAPTPNYPDAGHVTLGIVYSKDGTNLDDARSDGTVAGTNALPLASLGQVGKIVHLYGVHVTALKAPTNANATDPAVINTLQGRPYQTDLMATGSLEPTLISSDSPDAAARPFIAQGYTFYKTIRYNPRGEAMVNGTQPCTRIIEIGLQPTHASVRDTLSTNLLAIQQTGIGGAVNIYRQ